MRGRVRKKVRVYIFYLDILLFSAHEHFLFLSPSRIFFYSLFPINLCETLFSFHLLARPHSIHPLLKVKVLRCSIVHEPSNRFLFLILQDGLTLHLINGFLWPQFHCFIRKCWFSSSFGLWRHYFSWGHHFCKWRHNMGIHSKMTLRAIKWRHHVGFSQDMFLLLILSCGVNIKSFASCKRKLCTI